MRISKQIADEIEAYGMLSIEPFCVGYIRGRLDFRPVNWATKQRIADAALLETFIRRLNNDSKQRNVQSKPQCLS
jgi:hypothetical protein